MCSRNNRIGGLNLLLPLIVFFLAFIFSCDTSTQVDENNGEPIEYPLFEFEGEQAPLSGEIVVSKQIDNGTRQLFVMNADGSNKRQITFSEEHNFYMPRWSPDGSEIVFVSDTLLRTDGLRIGLMNDDGSNIRLLYVNGDPDLPVLGSNPAFSPDGKKIVFDHCPGCEVGVMNSYIYVFDLETKQRSRLSEGNSWDSGPSWSKAGDRIIFSSDRDSKTALERDLYLIEYGSDLILRVTEDSFGKAIPRWSPNDKYIAYVSRPLDRIFILEYEKEEIYFIDSMIGGERFHIPLSWSPDGSRLLVHSDSEQDKDVHYLNLIDLTTMKIERVIKDSSVMSSDWLWE